MKKDCCFVINKIIFLLFIFMYFHVYSLAWASKRGQDMPGLQLEDKSQDHIRILPKEREEEERAPSLSLNILSSLEDSLVPTPPLSTVQPNLLAHLSHEMRTPLTGILGTLEIIDMDSLSPQNQDFLKTIHGSALILFSLVNNFLDVSKIEAGLFKLEVVRFNPREIAEEAYRSLEAEAVKKNLKLELEISSHIPRRLMGDPTRLRQIFFNLLDNAIKFTEEGTISISLGGEQNSNQTHFTLLGQIRDTGIGIAPETQVDLFKSFFQADSSMLRHFGGAGLGLFITKRLCEMMNGNISILSELGKGSTFEFRINLKLPQIQQLIQIQHIQHQEIRPYEFPSPRVSDQLPNLNILIVEDNLTNQIILVQLLKKAGCTVTVACNGQEAVNAVVPKNSFDIILMDGEMPIMDGLTATRLIRETFDAKSLPIIGVTAHAMISDRERFLDAGMNSYLTKPVQKQLLYNEILRCYSAKEPKEKQQDL